MKIIITLFATIITLNSGACVECSGYPHIHFLEQTDERIVVNIAGEIVSFKPKPGYWTQIDPDTGKIYQIPIEEVIKK